MTINPLIKSINPKLIKLIDKLYSTSPVQFTLGSAAKEHKKEMTQSHQSGSAIDILLPTPIYDDIIPPKPYNSELKTNIALLIKACDKYQFFTPVQKASVLGIVGGECEWKCQEEYYEYSSNRLLKIFPSIFHGNASLANKYANWKTKNKGTRAEFFNFIYGPTTPQGKILGNIKADDGGKYYGRGFIQLTGRYNYEKFAKLSGIPIDERPDMMNDPQIAADITVLFFKQNIPSNIDPKSHPDYYLAALNKVGYNSPDIAKKKRGFYEYFKPLLQHQELNDLKLKASYMSLATAVQSVAKELQIPLRWGSCWAYGDIRFLDLAKNVDLYSSSQKASLSTLIDPFHFELI